MNYLKEEKKIMKDKNMSNSINQAFTEVYDIIIHMEDELIKKIPQDFLNIIKSNRDLSWDLNIDYNESINTQEILHETRIILSLIYRDYICTSEERTQLLKKEKIEIQREEEILSKKYEIDFKTRKEKNKQRNEIQKEEKNVYIQEIKQEKWYEKIINKILKIFKIKKK